VCVCVCVRTLVCVCECLFVCLVGCLCVVGRTEAYEVIEDLRVCVCVRERASERKRTREGVRVRVCDIERVSTGERESVQVWVMCV